LIPEVFQNHFKKAIVFCVFFPEKGKIDTGRWALQHSI